MIPDEDISGIPLEMQAAYASMTDLYADVARNMAVVLEVHAAAGQRPSCTRGCDACCHQLVLATVAEAEVMAEALQRLPGAERAKLEGRLDAWLRETSTLRHTLQQSEPDDLDAVVEAMAESYWARRIPCPFLVDRACALHEARPLACRQHHALGDPKHCAEPDGRHVEQMEAMEDLFFLAQDAISGKDAEIGIFPELVALLGREAGA
ncbi:MAG: YkgJ family cysteine cluster protein [Candidatus Sericytochromatia bacterium]|nr:YkgJ family cysteine cluster protein [Candidatus Sericytochromatia bacterium]